MESSMGQSHKRSFFFLLLFSFLFSTFSPLTSYSSEETLPALQDNPKPFTTQHLLSEECHKPCAIRATLPDFTLDDQIEEYFLIVNTAMILMDRARIGVIDPRIPHGSFPPEISLETTKNILFQCANVLTPAFKRATSNQNAKFIELHFAFLFETPEIRAQSRQLIDDLFCQLNQVSPINQYYQAFWSLTQSYSFMHFTPQENSIISMHQNMKNARALADRCLENQNPAPSLWIMYYDFANVSELFGITPQYKRSTLLQHFPHHNVLKKSIKNGTLIYRLNLTKFFNINYRATNLENYKNSFVTDAIASYHYIKSLTPQKISLFIACQYPALLPFIHTYHNMFAYISSLLVRHNIDHWQDLNPNTLNQQNQNDS